MKALLVLTIAIAFERVAAGQTAARSTLPIIDAHLHAESLKAYIANPADSRWWPKDLKRPSSNEELMRQSLAALDRYNIVYAITSESLEGVERWRKAAPERIIPALLCTCTKPAQLASARQWAVDGRIKVLGEIVWQYEGLTPADPIVEPAWKLAEELDLPVGIHMGLQPSGWSQTINPKVRIGNGNPLLLEDALVKHPKARVYVMHAGWPHLDAMVAMLHQYPQLYVDVSWIDWYIPSAEFHFYLRRLVEAGFSGRIMFGSDQMQWPDAIGLAIERIASAPFLTDSHKRDILYNNAARFFRLDAKSDASTQ